MGKKRRNRGRRKGNRGRGSSIQCASCGARVPRDKAKRVNTFISMVGGQLGKDLRKQGAYMPRVSVSRWYCISCAIHRHVVSPRSKDERKFTRNKMNRRKN